MILSGEKIREEVEAGHIVIDPFRVENIRTNSYDVTLANELWKYKEQTLDVTKKPTLEKVKVQFGGWLLLPGVLYLARTEEYTETYLHMPRLNGRSSIGRLGISIHVTAGDGDVGFKGYWTMEMSVIQPVWVIPWIRIGQLLFHEVAGDVVPYNGKYQGNNGIQESLLSRDYIR